MKRFAALLVILSTLAVAAIAAGGVAHAACEGPTISYRGGEIEAGDVLVIEGSGWGDNCYDTGPPPGDEGVLGRPLVNIEVFLVQNGVERLVARGDADQNYEFSLDVKMPSDLVAGRVQVAARAGLDTGWVDREPILKFIPGGPELMVDVVTFGPDPGADGNEVLVDAEEAGEAIADSEGSSSMVAFMAGGLAALVVVGGAAALVLGRRGQ